MLTEKIVDDWKHCPDAQALLSHIQAVNTTYSKLTKFDQLDCATRKKLGQYATQLLESDTTGPELLQAILELIRYISRDPLHLNDLISTELVMQIFSRAHLTRICPLPNINVMLEADKSLVNILYHGKDQRELFEQHCLETLMTRLEQLRLPNRSQTDFENAPIEIIDQLHYLNARLAFVMSGNSRQIQSKWNSEEAIGLFLAIINDSLYPSKDIAVKENLASEMLKIMFNVYCHAKEFNEVMLKKVADVCREIILSSKFMDTLKQDVINVLATMPSEILATLCHRPGINEADQQVVDEIGPVDLSFANCVLKLLDRKMETAEPGDSSDLLGTYFTVLIHICTSCKEARRCIRMQVMPPLRAEDVMQRPDEGATLRNRIVRLMSGVANCRHLAAEFLFVLSKRSVSRLIKYTGFGHAAGLLANYGFLGQLGQPRRPSDSEDSDTEDYKQIESQVNPVTGYVQPAMPDPMAGMTEEQKEYEAEKLAQAMHKLLDRGIIKPGTIGPDGQLRPVEHVLELIKDVKTVEKKDSDDEEDSVD